MQFRCYSCGYKFADGLPPLEALDKQQAAIVGGLEDSPARFAVLEGTQFEGMSTYSFCSFCLMAIQEAVEAVTNRPRYPGHHTTWSGIDNTITCQCGDVFEVPPGASGHHLGNRWLIQHVANIIKPDNTLKEYNHD